MAELVTQIFSKKKNHLTSLCFRDVPGVSRAFQGFSRGIQRIFRGDLEFLESFSGIPGDIWTFHNV